MKLIIVESPTKAKTISRFLGKDYKVESSYGHLRDLPKKEIGVDVENDFKPTYIAIPKAKKRIAELKKLVKNSTEVILASDEDREGEAIAWHIIHILDLSKNGKKKYSRIVFHEITKDAIEKALENPRDIDFKLVNAQQARRILDRLVGYKLSPLLWKKVKMGLSAGRVQSVAVRLICDREEDINKFKPQEYWTIEADLNKSGEKDKPFVARLAKKDDKALSKLGINNKKEANKILDDLKKATYKVVNIEKKEVRKSPPPPFITSTLQQAAIRNLGFSAKQTMMLAQQLYEGIEINDKSEGLITYMRTDSYNLAETALNSIKSLIEKEYGQSYSLSAPRFYKKKSKNAQEAHEAIRPTDFAKSPESIKSFLEPRQYRLYNLIWKRAIACQMQDAILDSTAIDIKANNYTFRANGSIVKFDGFSKIYSENKDIFKEALLPNLELDEILELIKLNPAQHFTEPPARYSEASLVAALEKYGIGRPSTYAPTLSTIQDRGYVEKIEKKFHPKEIGTLVNKILKEHFPNIVDIEFTAQMEEDLDLVAQDKKEWVKTLSDFYNPFIKNIKKKEKELSKKKLTEEKTDKKCPKCGKPVVIKLGRFGKFYACSNYPDCKHTEPLEEEKKEKEKINEKCEKCGSPMELKIGRFGKFLACSKYPDCKNTKPFTVSLNVKCPKCKIGEIVEKRTKKGRNFYACNKYPDCDFAMWQKPSGKKCPKCDSLLIYAGKNKIKCSKKECGYEEENNDNDKT